VHFHTGPHPSRTKRSAEACTRCIFTRDRLLAVSRGDGAGGWCIFTRGRLLAVSRRDGAEVWCIFTRDRLLAVSLGDGAGVWCIFTRDRFLAAWYCSSWGFDGNSLLACC
jgi:hypothetical protein